MYNLSGPRFPDLKHLVQEHGEGWTWIKPTSFGGLGRFLVAYIFRRVEDTMPNQWYIHRNAERTLQVPSKRYTNAARILDQIPAQNNNRRQADDDEGLDSDEDRIDPIPPPTSALENFLNAEQPAAPEEFSNPGNTLLPKQAVSEVNLLKPISNSVHEIVTTWFESIPESSGFIHVKWKNDQKLFPLGAARLKSRYQGRTLSHHRYRNFDEVWNHIRIMFRKIFSYKMTAIRSAHEGANAIGFRYVCARSFSNTGAALIHHQFEANTSVPRAMYVPDIDNLANKPNDRNRVRFRNQHPNENYV